MMDDNGVSSSISSDMFWMWVMIFVPTVVVGVDIEVIIMMIGSKRKAVNKK
jgi:hypothetical protein